MFHLGIPTSRAASLIVSNHTKVKRDKLYTGDVIEEKCAVVMRVAPTFMRFGSFEIFHPKDNYTGRAGPSPSPGMQKEMMPNMLNYVIKNFYPKIDAEFDNQRLKTKAMFIEVVGLTAKTVALWQCNGFCHGVLNTDNMSILGLTIDYGPYAFMEHYNPKFICNHSDKQGRYRYEAQP